MKVLKLEEITDTKLKRAINERCKQCDCGEKRDEVICKDCELRPNRFAPKNAVMKYCKSCRNGNSLEFCGCEETCPLYKFMPAIIQEVADKIRGNN